MTKTNQGHGTDALFIQADKMWGRGKNRAAFRLFLEAAKQGNTSCLLNVGYCFDIGLGTRRNTSAAIYWYKRAYKRGHASAAHNIGTVWRDRGKPQRAQFWFKRAVELGAEGSNLEIAKYELARHNPRKAIKLLEKVRDSQSVSEGEVEEAEHLLTRCMKSTPKSEASKGILRYRGSGIWKGNLKSSRRNRI